MAITNTDRSATHTGNGATTAFEYTFQIPDADSLFVQLLEISTGTLTDVAAIDYTATGLGTESGGFVNYPLSGSPLASTHKIIIYRQVPAIQTTIITNQVRYYADVAMRVWDRIVMMVQDLRADSARSLKVPVGESLDDLPAAATRAGKYVYFNALTGAVEAAGTSSLGGAVDLLGFNNSAQVVGIGELAWNDTDKTLDLGMTSSVTQQIGQEVLHYCKNNSGVAIANGQVVRVTGASGNALTIALADATDAVTSVSTIGVATEDIADAASGMVTMIGLVRGIDTSAFTEGDTLYLSETAGALTATSPAYPAQSIKIAVVVRDHATLGSIFVHVENMQSEIAAKQPLDADLTALAELASTGMIARTGAGTVAARTLTAGTGISITEGDGVAGNPTITAGAAGWEAYNTTGDGKFYDFAVHGAVASVETPTFADGYEYMIIAESFGKGVSGAALTFQIELYRNQAAAYAGAAAFFLTTGTAALSVTGFAALYLPRRTVRSHYIIGHMATATTNTTTGGGLFYNMVNHTTATKIDKARVSWSTGALSTSGKLYLYRRILA